MKTPSTKSSPPATVDAYLKSLPTAQRVALEKLRATIKAAAPKAEEVISYQIPGYKYHGPLVYYAAFKNHLSFFSVSKALLQEFNEALSDFKIAGTTIHFSPENPLPASLVRKLVKARMKQNEAKLKKKLAKKP